MFDNWLTLHQGGYCKNTIVLKDKNYAYPCGHCTVITADRHPFHSLSSVRINKTNTNTEYKSEKCKNAPTRSKHQTEAHLRR